MQQKSNDVTLSWWCKLHCRTVMFYIGNHWFLTIPLSRTHCTAPGHGSRDSQCHILYISARLATSNVHKAAYTWLHFFLKCHSTAFHCFLWNATLQYSRCTTRSMQHDTSLTYLCPCLSRKANLRLRGVHWEECKHNLSMLEFVSHALSLLLFVC